MEFVTIGGRQFLPADLNRRTVLLDHYLHGVIVESGVDVVAPVEGESDVIYLARLHGALLASGKASDLLGGYLLPDGVTERDWTPATAKATAAHLGHCDTEEDRDTVSSLAVDAVMRFFQQRLRSLERSRKSSGMHPAQPLRSPLAAAR